MKQTILSFVFISFLLSLPCLTSAGSYYECKDRDGNVMLTDQPEMPGCKCDAVMQYEDKTDEEKLQEEKEISQKQYAADQEKRELAQKNKSNESMENMKRLHELQEKQRIQKDPSQAYKEAFELICHGDSNCPDMNRQILLQEAEKIKRIRK